VTVGSIRRLNFYPEESQSLNEPTFPRENLEVLEVQMKGQNPLEFFFLRNLGEKNWKIDALLIMMKKGEHAEGSIRRGKMTQRTRIQ
jgi:hypothetical protein